MNAESAARPGAPALRHTAGTCSRTTRTQRIPPTSDLDGGHPVQEHRDLLLVRRQRPRLVLTLDRSAERGKDPRDLVSPAIRPGLAHRRGHEFGRAPSEWISRPPSGGSQTRRRQSTNCHGVTPSRRSGIRSSTENRDGEEQADAPCERRSESSGRGGHAGIDADGSERTIGNVKLLTRCRFRRAGTRCRVRLFSRRFERARRSKQRSPSTVRNSFPRAYWLRFPVPTRRLVRLH